MDTATDTVLAPLAELASTDSAPSTVEVAPIEEAAQAGLYTIEHLNGAYRLRSATTGKLLRESFGDESDARWYATRLTRLTAYTGFGGTRKLFMPKVPAFVGQFEIVAAPKGWAIRTDDGQVGPVFTHKANGKVDAFRWAERCERTGRGA